MKHLVARDVTGSEIAEALVLQCARKDFLSARFKKSIFQFTDQIEQDPEETMQEFIAADAAVAGLQALQDAYNLEVNVSVGGEVMSLALAIKTIGGLGRQAKMWKEASAAIPGESRFYSADISIVRKEGETVAQRQIPVLRCQQHLESAMSLQSLFRIAIRQGNQVVKTMDVDPAWFA